MGYRYRDAVWMDRRRVKLFDGPFGWAGPHGETEGIANHEHPEREPREWPPIVTVSRGKGWWLSATAGGIYDGGDPGGYIAYTRRRVAGEWDG